MAAVEAHDYKVVLYKSEDLKTWEHLSDFGPANATGGIWECPDLFALPVDGNPLELKWVLTVNLNPGGPNGGSAGQYFTGDFDGVTIHLRLHHHQRGAGPRPPIRSTTGWTGDGTITPPSPSATPPTAGGS